MMVAYDTGMTLEELGLRYGLSREAVAVHLRPIWRARGFRHPATPRLQLRPDECAAAIRRAIRGDYRRSVEPPEMTAWLERFNPSPLIATRDPRIERQQDLGEIRREWVADVQAAAGAMGEPLRRDDYDQWAAQGGRRSSQTSWRTGWTWGQLCAAAGVAVTDIAEAGSGPRSDRRWTRDRCLDVVDTFVTTCIAGNRRPTAAALEKWCRRSARRPSAATIRIRVPELTSHISHQCTLALSTHFAPALDALDAGILIRPETYVGADPMTEPGPIAVGQ